ncbi:ceramidase-domain-containing protein [Dactylonectria macrodidyma]|uniref:Ceramidase-domain-containing protein n=1 Tax=Dactylonectria macrodidyma TaxID=307937 RepID=A0A9P9IZI4_9HYPO|nr:ceramidase-domain-containing protein [Dactylonectria macrodidyma]
MASLNILRSLRAPYPDYKPGFWGQQTSTLNFCEEDYVLSFYCAEFCNTLTNGLFLWLGFKGIRNCLKYSHPGIFLVAYIGYIVVGMGSISFHTTLKYPMQLVDELSMIYTTCLMMYASFSHSRSKVFSRLLGVSLLALAAFITLYYYITKNPDFHQTAYGLLTALVVFRSMWVMESQLRPALKERDAETSGELLRTMWAMVVTGLAVFLGGYLLWTLDNEFCAQVTGWRRSIGLPWAVLLEGHAWWHLMTGLGGNTTLIHCEPDQANVLFLIFSPATAYYYITWGIWLRRCLTGHGDEYMLYWPRLLTSIPEVRRVKEQGAKQQ